MPEVKTATLVPVWAQALVQRFGLVQGGFSKYCYALDRGREAWAEQRVSPWQAQQLGTSSKTSSSSSSSSTTYSRPEPSWAMPSACCAGMVQPCRSSPSSDSS